MHKLLYLFLFPYRIQTTAKAQSEAEYPAYGLTGPSAHTPSNMSVSQNPITIFVLGLLWSVVMASVLIPLVCYLQKPCTLVPQQ